MILPTSSLSGQLYLHRCVREAVFFVEDVACAAFCVPHVVVELIARSAHPVTAYRPNGSSDFCHWGSRFRFQAHDPTHGAIHNHIHWLDHQVSVLVHRWPWCACLRGSYAACLSRGAECDVFLATPQQW